MALRYFLPAISHPLIPAANISAVVVTIFANHHSPYLTRTGLHFCSESDLSNTRIFATKIARLVSQTDHKGRAIIVHE